MPRAAFAPAVLWLVACTGQPPGQEAADSLAPTSAAAAPVPSDTLAEPPVDLLSPEVRLACDKAATYWAQHPSAVVRSFDSLVTLPRSISTADACWVTVRIEVDTPASRDEPRVPFPAAGWRKLYEFQADGPDGMSTVFQLVPVRCLDEESWDGGDDSDSTYVPKPWFQQRVACWRR